MPCFSHLPFNLRMWKIKNKKCNYLDFEKWLESKKIILKYLNNNNKINKRVKKIKEKNEKYIWLNKN